MSLSFEDSLKKNNNNENNIATTEIIAEDMNIAMPVAPMVMSLNEDFGIAAYAGDDGSWTQHSGYTYYSTFSDDNLSVINDKKEINLNDKQINITQEENSQFIPFEMSRYYDGYDLTKAALSIHYETKNGRHGSSKAINVTYNNEKIRFGWLVDAGATLEAGKLKFEIHAYGTVRGNDGISKGYTWKTKPNESLNVLQSLCDCENVINNIDDTWIQELVADVAEKVAEQIAEANVEGQVVRAEDAAARAEDAANNAENIATTTVSNALSSYSTTSEMQSYVTTEIANADIDGKLTEYAKTSEVNELIGDIGENENVVDYINEAVASVDVTEQLKDYAKTNDVDAALLAVNNNLQNNYYDKVGINGILEPYATKDDVSTAIEEADISEKLNDYYTKSETYSKTEIDTAIENVEVDLTGYATETYVDNRVSPLSSSVGTNTENISSLSTALGELQSDINSIDKSPRLTYDVEYNDVENSDVGENVFVLYEIENEGKENEKKEAKKKFTIVGGGGATSSSSLKIGYVTTSPLVVTVNDKAIIKYTFSGTDSSGDAVSEGNATWKINSRAIATNIALNGENEFDVTDYLSVGTQKVNLSITDEAGSLVTKTWTVQKIDVRLESTFNDKLTYPMGTVSFDYTPYGAVSKDIHFILDDKEIGKVTTSTSGIPMAFEIPAQAHGSHLLEVYITAKINGNDIESNHIVKDILWYDNASAIPVIGTVYQNFTARQYDATNIEYTVYDPTTETPTVEIAVDGVVVSTPTLDKSTNVYSFKTDVIGEHIITITCGETVKTLKANVAKLDIDIEPVTAGLAFDFNPSGKSNNDIDRVWSDGNVSMSVSDNFDWVNGGYQYDENGDQYFCIKAGTSAEINYQLFADDAKKNGKEMKLVFKTTNVAKPDATFLHCIDNTTGTDHIGIQMDVHEAFIYGQSGKLDLAYSEEDIIEFEFNISKNTEAIPMVMGYEDGVSSRPMVYDDSHNFTQNTPKVISLGSEDCDLHIYRFKVYNTSLTDRGILNNFIADARNAEEMIARYDRNQIYDENQNLDPDVLAEKCPWLRVYVVSAPYFTNNKSDKVPNTTIRQIYKGGDPVLDNWTCYNCSHSGQGTSSNNYGAAGRNLDFIMNNSQIEGVEPYFVLGDGTQTTEITMTRTSVPIAYLNAKVNIASSNNLTNAMLANRHNEFQPYNRPFIRDDGVDTSFIKNTMEFHNAVIFIQETNEDLSTHREFADCDTHFYGICNIGDSKKNDSLRKTDIDDPYEFCVEIMDVELPLSDFPVDTMYNAMGYKEDETTHERTYTWAKNENLGILYEKINGEYVLTEDTEVNLDKIYYVDILEHDDFSEDFTYGWRYISNKKDPEIVNFCKQKWIEFYRFVTTSTDEEFKNRFDEYFVKDTALYYFLFAMRYCLVDNLAKNLFFHYGKTGEVDSDGNPIRKFDLTWAYDLDTGCGLNNYGKQVYRYGLETIDKDEKGEEIFRESDSTFFCRVRDLFSSELKAMYNTLESKNAWHAESFINKADEWQGQFPEELWRVDIERKYLRTYNSSFINGKGDAQFLTNMANGKMKYHRRQWERSQEKYMASKYQSSVASGDNSVFRCSVPNGDLAVKPNYRLKLTPYAYIYLNVKYGTQNPIQLRAEPNKTYEIPFDGEKADIVDVYSSSLIQDFGDLSTCYVATADTSKASKVKKLIFGNNTEGYDNPNFTTLTTGANYLLEELNIENVSGLTQSLNLTALNNLKKLYAHGSNIGGVTFADGGRIEIAELPAINALTMKNLMHLTNLDVADFSKLTTLTVENCSTVDLLDILDKANNINRIRITGVDWSLEDTSLLNRLYAMKGIDKNGYNADQSVVSGKVHIPTIEQKEYNDFVTAWSDLEITYNTMVLQHPVTFVNDDGTVLEVQYVNEGDYAIEPTKRADNPIPTPTKESTVSTNYTFAGWDNPLTSQIFAALTVTAVYGESTREYTIRYVSKSASGTIVKQESVGKYGENIPYDYEANGIPTYTYEEGAYNYYLFNRWDKSGFVDGDKTVTAVFDSFKYTGTSAFSGKDLADLKPVEIYALSKLTESGKTPADFGMSIDIADQYSFTMGYDIDFDDIESNEIISERTTFNGTNYLDTGIKLFDEDRDFVLALDYTISEDNESVGTFMQCFQTSGSNGFKLGYSGSAPDFVWGSATAIKPSSVDNREMLVIRHKKGDNNLYVYVSNLDSTNFVMHTINKTTATQSDNATLIFGAAKMDSGRITSYCMGDVHWCKIWYQDLGEKVCEQLVGWTHEEITLGVSGFYRYPLYDDRSKETMVSLVASHLLDRTMKYNSTNTNVGGWASSDLNRILNTRFYNAVPVQIRLLLKKMCVLSTIGQMSTELSESGCYINIPSVYDVDSAETNYKNELYSGASTISSMASNKQRIREFRYGYDNDNVDAYSSYWLRSPNIAYQNYVWSVNENYANHNSDSMGSTSGFNTATSSNGVVIEISF